MISTVITFLFKVMMKEVTHQFSLILGGCNKSEAKVCKLSLQDQDKYAIYHPHIAPELVWGNAAQSSASDIILLGR